MKLKSFFYPLIALVIGAVGAVLHHVQLQTIVDEATGLAQRWATISIVLAGVCVLGALLALILALTCSHRSAPPVWHRSLAAKTVLPLLLSIVGFAGMLYAAWFCWRWGLGASGAGTLDKLLAVFAALAGLGWLLLSISSLRKKHSGLEALSALLVVLFLCLWLVLSYQAPASGPTKIKYLYDLLGLCAATVGSYYLAGFAFGRSRPRGTVFFCLLAITLCAVAVPIDAVLPVQIFAGFTLLYLFVNVLLLLRNLGTELPEEAAEAEPEPEAEPADPFPLPNLGEPEDLTDGLLQDMPETDEAPPALDDILNEYRDADK